MGVRHGYRVVPIMLAGSTLRAWIIPATSSAIVCSVTPSFEPVLLAERRKLMPTIRLRGRGKTLIRSRDDTGRLPRPLAGAK